MTQTIDNKFKIKFDGQQHQIDANVLIGSLIHTTSIIQEVNKYLDSGKKIDIKVKALEKGSFFISLELVETAIDGLKNIFTRENITVAAEVITILTGVIGVKKFLKGRKPRKVDKKGDKTTIINHNGDSITVENLTFNIYETNVTVNDALSQNFEIMESDPAITGFEITDVDENPLVVVNKEEFPDMILKSEEIRDDERILSEAATMNIVRLSFEESLKWEFYYRGNRISAKIKDPNFQESIDGGESFAKGDILEVELQTTQKWDSSVNTFINKSYQINKIIRHIRRNEEQTFNFDE
ncbi:MAG: hypothetical protein LBV38_06160 [Alistipes sp.]|jgi:hypothetical protein|nr:hypothetical protein [Alistipes sp.]